MKKIFFFAVAMVMTAVFMVSCDSTASEIKVERVTSEYQGQVVVGLYVPDYEIENENVKYTGYETIGLCADTVNASVLLDFATNDQLTIGVKNLKDVRMNITFLNPKDSTVRDIFEYGYLAFAYNRIKSYYKEGKITKEEFDVFYNMVDTINDKITLTDIQTAPMNTIERGAMVATYDFEQNSYYTRFTLGDFEYYRSNQVIQALNYLGTLLQSKGIADAELAGMDKDIRNAVMEHGTVTDGTGWCTMAYANYHASIDMHVEEATGLFNVLSIALFGAQLDQNNKPVLDDYGHQIPNYDLWFIVEYEGTIENTGGWNRIN